jgi:4-amino-4-deoxy-L-arabinose transferase-like glycosyltransferase
VSGQPGSERAPALHLAILIGLCLLLFFSLLGQRPLWDIDEGMHAATSKDMVLSGDWVTPTLDGEPFFDKPPLFNWLVALSFLVFGFTELAARLPAALAGTACVLATYALGSRMFDRTVGLLGGVILASSLEFLLMSRVVVHDIVLALPVTVALLGFWLAFSSEQRRARHLLLFYLACGVAVLDK